MREERERKEREVDVVLKREADATSRYWDKEREVREVRSCLTHIEWQLGVREGEEAASREERGRLQRRVEEVEVLIKHMDALGFARDEEVKALLGEVEGYKAELLRRVIEVGTLKEELEAGKEREGEERKAVRETQAALEGERATTQRLHEDLALAHRRLTEWEGGEEDRARIIHHLETELRALIADKEGLVRELSQVGAELQRVAADRQRLQEEAVSLTSDVELMLRENAQLSARLAEVRAGDDARAAREEGWRRRLEAAEADATAREAERVEVTREWRVTCLEVDRLRAALADADARTERLRVDAAQEGEERKVVGGEVTRLTEERRRLRGEVEGWKAQNEELVRLLDAARREVGEVREEGEAARREVKSLKVALSSADGVRVEGQRREVELTSALRLVREEVERVEREREGGRVVAEGLRDRCHALEVVVQG